MRKSLPTSLPTSLSTSLLTVLLVSSLLACNPGTPTGTGSPPDPNTPPPVTDPGPSDPSTPDTTAPTITSSQPENNTQDVAINSSILVSFSEPMKGDTLQISSSPNLNLGTGTWVEEGTAIEFTPSSELAANTEYTLQISSKDLAGNPLSGSSIKFKTTAVKDTTAPNTPQDLKATAGEGEVKLEWKKNTESDLKGYRVFYGLDANNLSSKTFVSKPGSSRTVSGLSGVLPTIASAAFSASIITGA